MRSPHARRRLSDGDTVRSDRYLMYSNCVQCPLLSRAPPPPPLLTSKSPGARPSCVEFDTGTADYAILADDKLLLFRVRDARRLPTKHARTRRASVLPKLSSPDERNAECPTLLRVDFWDQTVLVQPRPRSLQQGIALTRSPSSTPVLHTRAVDRHYS